MSGNNCKHCGEWVHRMAALTKEIIRLEEELKQANNTIKRLQETK